MQHLLKSIQDSSFSDADILDAIDNKANLITYDNVKKYNTIDELLGEYGCCVLLYLTKANYGHWVCLLKANSRTIEYFDSYALPPDGELDFIPESIKKRHGEEKPYLSMLLDESPYTVIYNTAKLQTLKDDNNTCGRHVVFRIIMRDLPLEQYVNLFNDKRLSPDQWIIALTAFIG